jgi:hypothetical protein
VCNLGLGGLGPLRCRHGGWSAAPPPGLGAPRGKLRGKLRGRFDLIVGGDLLHEQRDDGATLAAFIARHAAPAGEVRSLDPDRGRRPARNRQMSAQGFELRESRLERAATATAAASGGRLRGDRRRPVARR